MCRQPLYIVRFLHQTTTTALCHHKARRLYIVRFLHQTTTPPPLLWQKGRCISFVSYIKPQLGISLNLINLSCISFVSYIKTQLNGELAVTTSSCISFVSYIKPQREAVQGVPKLVVYRSFPTSNHNSTVELPDREVVVYRSFPTSNHNLYAGITKKRVLYIVRFLHQTTTCVVAARRPLSCISFVSYIKPQLNLTLLMHKSSCISFVSYIKPQHVMDVTLRNHRCISFVSYIKPQP